MNDFHDIEQVPDFSRTVWLVKKDSNGKNDWWTLNNKNFPKEQWFELCERNKFFAWSYTPWGVTR